MTASTGSILSPTPSESSTTSSDTTPTGDSCSPTPVSGAAGSITGTSLENAESEDVPFADRVWQKFAADVKGGKYGDKEDLTDEWTAAFEAQVEREERLRARPGEDGGDVDWGAVLEVVAEYEEERRALPGGDKHPLNVAAIKEGMGCIEGLCEVEIDFSNVGLHHVVRHTTPAHDRTYTQRSYSNGPIKSQVTQTYDRRTSQMAIDPYLLEWISDSGDVAVEIIRRLRDEWQHNWPQHA